MIKMFFTLKSCENEESEMNVNEAEVEERVKDSFNKYLGLFQFAIFVRQS